MRNEVIIRPDKTDEFSFVDREIIKASIASEVSLVGRSLTADAFSLKLKSDKTGMKKLLTSLGEWYSTINNEGYYIDEGNMLDYTYGDEIVYNRDSSMYAKYYITEISRVGHEIFNVDAYSGIGLLARQRHVGGVYNGVTAGDLIDEIMSGTGIPYTVDTDVRNQLINNGWLRYGNKRDNLVDVLFAIGANIVKEDDGTNHILFYRPETSKSISGRRIYYNGGQDKKLAPATKISLTEHQFFYDEYDPAIQLETVHRHTGASADHVTVVFDEPIVVSTLDWDIGITVHDSGANYVTYSGSGSIYAVKYVHQTMDLIWEQEAEGEEKTYTFDDATLVTALNSANVMKRLVKFYTESKESNLTFAVEDEKPGDYITYNDKYGNEKNGFIQKLNVSISGTNRGEAEVVTDWYPSDSGNAFNSYELYQSTGTITVPQDAVGKPGRLILFGGFRGGQGGTQGEAGSQGSYTYTGYGINYCEGGEAGEGGEGGAGGIGVMVRVIDIDSMPASFSVDEIGEGGAGGAAGAHDDSGSLGELGGNTKVTINGTQYSSASGTEYTSGFPNIIDGTWYIYPGSSGYAASAGGDGQRDSNGRPGNSLTVGGTTWAGGARGKSAINGYNTVYGGGGGGAAYGKAGGNGIDGDSFGPSTGDGGAGANAVAPSKALFPYCGSGGNGGGGGGGSGGGHIWSFPDWDHIGGGGRAGNGSAGGQGADGAVLGYYGG